jgi:type VI secretion system protein ImpF
MARPKTDKRLLPSILDRMIDERPRDSSEGADHFAGSLEQIKDAVKRDLEWLLNSRQVVADLPDDLREIERSMLTYGLPDFTSMSLSSPGDQDLLRRTVEGAIKLFEPRLMHVRVAIEAGREVDRSLRFRIDAMLKADPEPEPITFDSVLNLATKAFQVANE